MPGKPRRRRTKARVANAAYAYCGRQLTRRSLKAPRPNKRQWRFELPPRTASTRCMGAVRQAAECASFVAPLFNKRPYVAR